jgi:hypothetical protein
MVCREYRPDHHGVCRTCGEGPERHLWQIDRNVERVIEQMQQTGVTFVAAMNALDQLAQPLSSLTEVMRDLDRACWAAMTPGQRRRAAKRLIREEQWQQYMERRGADHHAES